MGQSCRIQFIVYCGSMSVLQPWCCLVGDPQTWDTALVGTPWRVGTSADETTSITMANNNKRRRPLELSSDDESDSQWPTFLVMEGGDAGGQPIKLNPFAIQKGLQGVAGTLKNVTKLRSGFLLLECNKKQQSLNLLNLKTFAGVAVKVTPHRFLNSSKGIVRDRSKILADMTEEELVSELEEQGVTNVKRFSFRDGDRLQPSNTYLMEFNTSTLPSSIKAGCCSIKVEFYIPNPLRCYKCQKFGHGTRSCQGHMICHICGGDDHESLDCEQPAKCSNCHGQHKASSKQCPIYIRETKILSLKYHNNISFAEARKMLSTSERQSYASAASTKKTVSTSTSTISVGCQTDCTWLASSYPNQIIV